MPNPGLKPGEVTDLPARQIGLPGDRYLPLDRPVIMGILNVTPDSFSDGGKYQQLEAAVRHGQEMAKQGAQIIDVGGESTRPGSLPVPAKVQIQRTVAVIRRLREQFDENGITAAISIDTTRATVAREALAAGAAIINDVSAGRDDPEMFALAAQSGAPMVLMHMRGTPDNMQDDPVYEDVVGQVEALLASRVDAAINEGIQPGQILIDPGIGFGKTTQHNLQLLRHLDRLVALGYPVLLGASRKRFLRQLCRQHGAAKTPDPSQITAATCATTVMGVAAGATVFRVHDVRANRQAADVAWAVRQLAAPEPA